MHTFVQCFMMGLGLGVASALFAVYLRKIISAIMRPFEGFFGES